MADTAVATESPAPATPAKKGPKASAAGGGAKKPKAKPTHPKTSEMVNSAIKELKERSGSSLKAIKKYIAAQYKVDAEKLAPFIRKYLKNAVESGALIQTKGKGASGSFKLESKTSKAASKKPEAASGKKSSAAKSAAKPTIAAAKDKKTPAAAKKKNAGAASPAKPKPSSAATRDKKAAAAKKKPTAAKKAAATPTKAATKSKRTTKPPTKKPKAPKPKSRSAATPRSKAPAKKATAAKK